MGEGKTPPLNRITVVLGHAGSGKTEFALNYSVKSRETHRKVAICDLDIINPYFRSREQQKELTDLGIRVIANTFGYDISEEIPAVSAKIKIPLQNKDYIGVYDLGGDDIGSTILAQIKKELVEEDGLLLLVVNIYRKETCDLKGIISQINRIEEKTGLKIKGLVNNSNLLEETAMDNVIKGHNLLKEVEKERGIPLVYDMVQDKVLSRPTKDNTENLSLFKVKLFGRPSWLSF